VAMLSRLPGFKRLIIYRPSRRFMRTYSRRENPTGLLTEINVVKIGI
jgi:hypothetical protein